MTTYDVFLSHASADKPTVEALARRLREDGLEPFLDKWHLVPGEPWQEGLEDALEDSRTCAVFVGAKLGPWQNEEMRVALDERTRNADFRVIPVLLPGALMPDKRDLPRFLRRLTWVDFSAGLDDDDAYNRLVCGIRGVPPDAGPATATPTSPGASRPYRSMAPASDQFVYRRELAVVRDLLVDAAGSTVGITTALRGAGGFGKTALAQALCEDPAVREAYPSGVLWAQMRDDMHDADRLAVVQDLVRFQRPGEKPGFETLTTASAYLREILAGQRFLVVVDDAWRSADAEPFRGLGPGAALLITTRDGGTLPAGCRRVEVDAMERSEAVRLLTSDLENHDLDALATRLDALAIRLGEWPLLLRLVNRQLRELIGDDSGLDDALGAIEHDLDDFGMTAFDVDDETAREKAVGRTLGASLRHLEDRQRQRFQELAVFPEDVDVPLAVLERLWDLQPGAVRHLCKRLFGLALLLRFDHKARTIRLHDVVRQYLVEDHYDLPGLHRRLLKQTRPRIGGWTELADDETYLWRHLAVHLDGAGDRAELRSLLFDLDYLEGKVRTVGVNALLADYDFLGETGEPRTVQEVLRLSSHVLMRDWGDLLGQVLASQLLGRLGHVSEEGGRLLERATDRALLRPRQVRMSRPGGPLIRTLEGHTDSIRAVAVLNEKRVVSASSDHTLRVWDVESGETIRTLEGHTSLVLAVAALDERRVVSASRDQTLRVWDVKSGEPIRTLKGHTNGVVAVAVLDEKHVVSASSDHTLRVWDVESCETICTLKGHTDFVVAVAVLGEKEKRMVSASYDHTLRVWDVESGETIRTLKGHTSWVEAVAVLDGTHVVSASNDQTLRIWDVESDETVPLKGHTNGVLAVAVLDERCVVSASRDQTLRVWDVKSGETIRTLEGHTSWVHAVAVLDEKEKRVVSASSDQTLRVWNVDFDETIRTLEGHTDVVAVVAVLDEKRVVSASNDQTLRVWDVDFGETIRTLEGHTSGVLAVAVLDETRVVSASSDQTLRVWDVESGETIRTHKGPAGVLAVAVLDETRVVSVSSDHTLRVWDVKSGETIRTLEGHTSGVLAVAVLDERRVVSASRDQTLRVWDVESGETIRTLKGHTGLVVAVAVLDERRVVSASRDQTLRVWDVESGATMLGVFAFDAPVASVAVTVDGRMVVAGDWLGGVHFLDLDP